MCILTKQYQIKLADIYAGTLQDKILSPCVVSLQGYIYSHLVCSHLSSCKNLIVKYKATSAGLVLNYRTLAAKSSL